MSLEVEQFTTWDNRLHGTASPRGSYNRIAIRCDVHSDRTIHRFIQTDQPSGDTYTSLCLILRHAVSCEGQSRKSPVESQISRHGLGVGVCLGVHHWGSLWGVLAGVGDDDHGAGLGHLLTGLGDDHWYPWHQGGSGLWDLYWVEDVPPGGENLVGSTHYCQWQALGLGARVSHSLQRKNINLVTVKTDILELS